MKLKNVLKIGVVPFCATALLGCTIGGTKADKVQVTFKNFDGTVLQTEQIKSGEDASYKQKDVPVKPSQTSAKNIFIGWDKDLNNITENTTFNAKYKTIDKFIDKDHDGMPEGIDDDDTNNHFVVGAKSMVYLEQEIDIDFSLFLTQDNSVYNNDIAKLGLFLSNPKIDFQDNKFTDKAYGGRVNALYSRLGFDDFHYFDFKDYARDNYVTDKNDTTSGVYGHKYLYDDEGNIVKDLITIAFEGTNGPSRWASNFDIGYGDDNSYYEKTGGKDAHPDWTDTRFHKGFFVAANRVLQDKVDGDRQEGPVKFIKYIDEHSSHSNGQPIIFVTGHSRGGAMAIIVGNYIENVYSKDHDCIPFTYSFASPCILDQGVNFESDTTFNVVNTDDIVTKVPHSSWGFKRIQKEEKEMSIIGNNLKEEYDKNLEKREYQRIEHSESIFSAVKVDRKEMYTINKEDKNLSKSKLKTYYTEEEAKEDLENVKKEYADVLGENFSKFYELAVVEVTPLIGSTYWAIQAYNCFGIITEVIQKVMLKDADFLSKFSYWLPLIRNDMYEELLFDIVINVIAGGSETISLPHDYGAYHVILKKLGEKNK